MADETVLDMVRRFAGADPETADAVLQMCYRAAVAWYEGADVPACEADSLWLFWACNLAAWMYDNRGTADVNAAAPAYIVTSVHQLRSQARQRLNRAIRDAMAACEDEDALADLAAALQSRSNMEKAAVLAELAETEPDGAGTDGTDPGTDGTDGTEPGDDGAGGEG